MNRKRTGVTVAVAGTAAAVTGLALLALPTASAGAAPVLPPVSAEQLVQSVLTSKQAPAFAGTVRGTNNLNLPDLGSFGGGAASKFLANGSTEVRVWSDGQGRGRAVLTGATGGETLVYDGTTLWDWTASNHTVRKSTVDKAAGHEHPDDAKLATDPASAAKQLVEMISKDSTVRVDGTGTVAGRPVYQLVLAPKPSERTKLREVRIAVDSETRSPLQLSVFANGTADPVLQIGFADLTVGAQDPALFQFTPPANAQVTEDKPKARQEHAPADVQSKVVGEGWDAVLVAKLPGGLPLPGSGKQGNGIQGSGKSGMDPNALLDRIGKPISGSWGSGHVVELSVASIVVTNDGRVAAGAVPVQVLTSALEQVK